MRRTRSLSAQVGQTGWWGSSGGRCLCSLAALARSYRVEFPSTLTLAIACCLPPLACRRGLGAVLGGVRPAAPGSRLRQRHARHAVRQPGAVFPGAAGGAPPCHDPQAAAHRVTAHQPPPGGMPAVWQRRSSSGGKERRLVSCSCPCSHLSLPPALASLAPSAGWAEGCQVCRHPGPVCNRPRGAQPRLRAAHAARLCGAAQVGGVA